MKLVLAGIFSLIVTGACLTATSAPFQQQQPNDYLAKESAGNTVSSREPANVCLIKDSIVERDTSFMQINTRLKAAALRLKQKVNEAEQFVIANNFNEEYCFMVDMSIPSGKRRFFVYNLKKDSIEFTSMVSHGSGSYKPNCNDQLIFSNVANSNCTSIGKYKIGNSYFGTYGLSYKLFGLDSTNSNAFARAIVLHSDAYVPERETFPRHIYESAGCPIVSPTFLSILTDKYLRTSKKPVLLWVYN
jgi:hypothetical protein